MPALVERLREWAKTSIARDVWTRKGRLSDALTEAADRIASLEAEVAALRKHLDDATHKVITCGVAASHPDPTLSRRKAYGGKWDSPQAEEVRKLRDDRDNLRANANRSPWIPVGERMPTDGDTVLVWCAHSGGFPAVNTWQMQRESPVSWSSATIPTGLMWDDYEFEEISHWMPLPAPPSTPPAGSAHE